MKSKGDSDKRGRMKLELDKEVSEVIIKRPISARIYAG